jgi:cell cycle checkpoint protein
MFKKKRKLHDINQSSTWNAKYAPQNVSDLAVHPKKIEEVKTWLLSYSDSIQNTNVHHELSKNILLLSGPPGCGKTATVLALSKELNLSIQEWCNPSSAIDYNRGDDSEFETGDSQYIPKDDTVHYESQITAFTSFMLRASRYGMLPGISIEQSCPLGNAKNKEQNMICDRKIVLIEELPSFAYKDTNEFHSILKQYQRRSHSKFPLVIIQSESKSSGSKEDSFRKLFPPDFLLDNCIHHIQFNAINPTNMLKALTSVAMIESSYSAKSVQIPDKSSLTALAASVNGDIRAAINALQFTCQNDDSKINDGLKNCFNGYTTLSSSSSTNSNSRKKSTKDKSPRQIQNKGGENNLATVGGKDPTIDLFHAIGKVLYCKREEGEIGEVSLAQDISMLPRKFQTPQGNITYARHSLKINPEELLEHIPISTPGAFTAFLHHSYLDFFGGATGIHEAAEAAESLSKADPFFNEWVSTGKISLSEYGGSIAIRGLCHPNTNSTKRVGGMKTFHKPELYNVAAKSKARFQLLSKYFGVRGLPNLELATVFAPMVTQCYPKEFRYDISEAVRFYPGYGKTNLQHENKVYNKHQPESKNILQKYEDEEIPEEDMLIEDFDD